MPSSPSSSETPRRPPYLIEVMGVRPGAGWIPVLAVESNDPESVRADLRAQGMGYVVETREYRVVPYTSATWSPPMPAETPTPAKVSPACEHITQWHHRRPEYCGKPTAVVYWSAAGPVALCGKHGPDYGNATQLTPYIPESHV